MQGTFWFALFTMLLTVAGGATWLAARHSVKNAGPQDRVPSRSFENMTEYEMRVRIRLAAKVATISLGSLTALLLLVSSFWIVGTSSIGVVTSFGRPVSTLPNGPGWTAPWDNVTELDYSVQVTDFAADLASCAVQLRLANSQVGCPKVNVRWQPNPSDADVLFRRYKSTQGVENGVLIPALQKYANEVFQNYDPVGSLSSPDPVGSPKNPSTSQLADQLEKRLSDVIGSEVTVDFLSIPNIAYPDSVQRRMNTILQQKASTQAAILAEQTATAQAAANKTIAASISHDPDVLLSRCVDLMGEMIKDGRSPTIGMCSFGGSSGPNVLIGAGK